MQLFVRGSGKVVLKSKTPRGDFVVGFDSEESFLVAPKDLFPPIPIPVVVCRDQERTEQFADDWGLLKKDFQLGNIVKLLNIDYKVALTRDSNKPRELIDFTGRRRKGAPRGLPEYIRIVADRRTAKLDMMVFTWGPDRPLGLPNLMWFKLAQEKSVPDSFYRHTAHHSADRDVWMIDRR